MRKPVAGLIDYDMGNLKSVSKALEKAGLKVKAVDSPFKMKGIDAVVLPGVGAFHAAVKNLNARKLFKPIQDWIGSKRPFLGICLGYQILFDQGKEGGRLEKGLGIFKGNVRKFPATKNLKVPHMGWNQVWGAKSRWFNRIPDGSYFYFVHSYFPVPEEKEIVATRTSYGTLFVSSIAWDHSFACQFHPEKSGENGLRLLKNFAALVQSC